MRKVILYIASSLDGYIARPDGNVDWLNDPDYVLEGEDYGYSEFYNSIDSTLMGNKTYQEILKFEGPFPYSGKENYVFTRSATKDNDQVKFIYEDIISFVNELKNAPGKDIWLIGGGEINSIFLENGLINRIILTLIPITLGDGLPMFPGHSGENKFMVKNSKVYESNLCQLVYDKKPTS